MKRHKLEMMEQRIFYILFVTTFLMVRIRIGTEPIHYRSRIMLADQEFIYSSRLSKIVRIRNPSMNPVGSGSGGIALYLERNIFENLGDHFLYYGIWSRIRQVETKITYLNLVLGSLVDGELTLKIFAGGDH
jgi:hypothetical protein